VTTKQVVILGLFVLLAALVHAGLSGTLLAPSPRPVRVGVVSGEILERQPVGVAHLKCDGFKVECYESFVVVHVDRAREPTWTGNYLLTIPWSQIEHLSLAPER
jgi:hypothetical protein